MWFKKTKKKVETALRQTDREGVRESETCCDRQWRGTILMKRGGRHFAHCNHFQFSPLKYSNTNSTNSILKVLYAFLSAKITEEIYSFRLVTIWILIVDFQVLQTILIVEREVCTYVL